MSTETAVTRLAKALVDPWNGVRHPLDLERPDHGQHVELTRDDAKALLDLHHDLCEQVVACEVCGTTLCPVHGLGDLSGCDGDIYHCADKPECMADCPPCAAAMGEDQAVDYEHDEAVCP